MSFTPIPFRYRDFYDVPRAILVEFGGKLYYFDCPFSEQLDDYGDAYSVYRLQDGSRIDPDAVSWESLPGDAEFIGSVPIVAVEFDPTKRRSVDSRLLERIKDW